MTCGWPAPCASTPGHDPGDGPGLRRLRLVRAADGPGGVLRHPPEGQRRLRGGRDAPRSRRQGRVRAGRGHPPDRAWAPPRSARTALRRVEVYDPEKDETLVFLTNHLDLRGHDHRRHLQGPLADRAVLQGAEAEPEDQDLRGDQRQRPEDPGLDGADRHAAPQVPPAAVPLRAGRCRTWWPCCG